MIKQVDIRAVEKDLTKTPKALVIKFRSGSMISRSMVYKKYEKCGVGMTIRSRATARGKGPFI
jgi:hypothetical protein